MYIQNKNYDMKFKSFKQAEQHAISCIASDEKVGYVILSERKWFRKWYYINYYFRTIQEKPEEINKL